MSSEGYSGPATITQSGRTASVQCGFHVIESRFGQMKEWRGWYKGAAAGDDEPDAGEAELRLENGSAGTINIIRALKGQGEGTFMGLGEPPSAA
jgi:hypothetical protein